MANQEHVDILRQGVEVWNSWRKEHSEVRPDLSEANLSNADLSGVDLSDANLSGANLSGAHLSGAHLSGIDLRGVDLSSADLSSADLSDANLRYANLSGAHLSGAHLSGIDLRGVDLSGAHLSGADLSGADLICADLSYADLSYADLNYTNLGGAYLHETIFTGVLAKWTIFGDLDLRTVKGLETLEHQGPSTIGTDTILKSEGEIPESFLRGAGLDDTFISYVLSLARKPIQYYTCFISYSSKNQAFAERLYADLQNNNVRCWYAPEDLKIGDKFRVRIDESIRLYDKLLLVLSEDSLASNWVAYEVERALHKEPEGTPNVLFPIRLDKTILTCETDWAKDIRKSRHIGDFEHWKDHDAYQHAFQRLLRDLKAQS